MAGKPPSLETGVGTEEKEEEPTTVSASQAKKKKKKKKKTDEGGTDEQNASAARNNEQVPVCIYVYGPIPARFQSRDGKQISVRICF